MGNKIGLSYEIKKIVTADVYFYSSQAYFLSPEISIRAFFLNRDSYRLYAGAGVFRGWSGSFSFPIGVEVKPFNSYPSLSFRFDVNMALAFGDTPPHLAPGLGICYSFGK
ncbi:MAG: hypothetical protein LBQ70_05065 [Prevotellaceae bacterium]|jgi:hypothetical protein|nr:hypothetical protein [Prevotellaceae bacterium]